MSEQDHQLSGGGFVALIVGAVLSCLISLTIDGMVPDWVALTVFVTLYIGNLVATPSVWSAVMRRRYAQRDATQDEVDNPSIL